MISNCDLEKVDQYLPKNRVPKINYNAYCNKYLLYWIGKLGLDDFKFRFYYEQKLSNLYKSNGIGYNEENDVYVIKIKYPTNKETLVHELGHLCLSNSLGCPKQINLGSKKSELNHVLDPFVDYRLCKFGEYYDLWVEYIEFKVKNQKYKPNLPLKTYLLDYTLYYINFKFLLKNELKLKLKPHVKRFLKDLRDNAIISSKGENKKLCYQDFQKIDRVLNNFDKIKNTNDSKDIYSFFDSVMAIIN